MKRCVLVTLALLPILGCAAPRRPADAQFLEQWAATHRFSSGSPRSITIAPDNSAVYYLRAPSRSVVQNLYAMNPKTGEERVLLTADKILAGGKEELTADELARRERMRSSARGVASYKLSADGKKMLVPLSGKLFVINTQSGAVKELPDEGGSPIDARFSPDGTKVACVRDGNLYVIEIATGEQRQLTYGASQNITFGTAEFIAQEEMSRFRGYWWAPDSKRVAYQRTDTSALETMHIADPTHPEKAPQTWPYPRPGKANAEVTLGVIPADGGDTVWVDWDRKKYPYLATVDWPKKGPLTILVQNREQTEERLLAVKPKTGETRTLLVERDDAWVNLDQSMPKWLADGSGFLWTTERNGSWQLELRGRDGQLVRAITPVDFGYQGFVSLNEKIGVVYLAGGDNPTMTHVYKAPLDGSDPPRDITNYSEGAFKPQHWEIYSAQFSNDHSLAVLNVPVVGATGSMKFVADVDGDRFKSNMKKLIKSEAEPSGMQPNLEFTTVKAGADGDEIEMHAVLVRPHEFSPLAKYPVILYVYGGPHVRLVRRSPAHFLLQQWMADQGYIVVSLDGRGTPDRGRDWERVIKNNLIDVPLHDQVAGLQALGRKFGELDMSRVGVFGWSFGGYFAANAVMREPEVFRAGVAGAPVTDWLDYDTHYTERYMGLPDKNAEGYEASSVLVVADRLERPLLLIHGTADDNVYFMHSLKLVDKLMRAGKPFDFLPMPGFTHGVREPAAVVRMYTRIMEFFDENLRN